MIFNFIGMVGIAVGVQIKNSTFALIFVCLYSCSFAIGNGSMLNVYTSEFLSVSGIGFAVGARWITAALISFIVPLLRDKIGIPAIFFICAGFVLMHIVMMATVGIETLDKSKHQIEEEFAGISKNSEKNPDLAEINGSTTQRNHLTNI